MTREECEERWATNIIPAVFSAENAIRKHLQAILKEYAGDKEKAARMYAKAIAKEIVRRTSDEELAQME